MQTWGVLRQVLSATLCVLLALPAFALEKTPAAIQPQDQASGGVYPKTRVWGSDEKILLHFRVVEQLSEKQHWDCEKCSEEIVVGSGVTYDYDAFGILIHSTGTTPNNYLFAGEQYDPDLHLYYNRARYLNVSTGRFWSMDSFEGDENDPPSLHKYTYTQNDPVNGHDATGFQTQVEEVTAEAVDEVISSIEQQYGCELLHRIRVMILAEGLR